MAERELAHALGSLEVEAETSFLGNIGLYSYGTALVAFSLLTVLALFNRRDNPLGNSLLLASALTALWAGSVTFSTLTVEPQVLLIQITEIMRNAAWTFVLLRLVNIRLMQSEHSSLGQRWSKLAAIGYIIGFTLLMMAGPYADALRFTSTSSSNIVFSVWLAMAVLGLLLIEQHFRNSNENELWPTKHLCIALGIVFAYDFFMYAEALLFQHLDRNFWQARGGVITMAAFVAAISLYRTGRTEEIVQPRSLYLSRHVAFHSLTLMASGLYLISMALAAYFLRYLGGSWGGVLQITFLVAAGMILIVLLSSGQIRSSTRVWLSKNFFSYKYDYRLEWLQFSEKLASGNNNLPMSVIQGIGDLAKSPAGTLWARGPNGRLAGLEHWEMPEPDAAIPLDSLARWLQRKEWIIDLHEWRRSPDMYDHLELPTDIADIPRAWLIIPLLFGDKLQGILLLKESEHLRELNWEDRDLLKVAGRQAATHLAQYQADQELVESRQFEAFNRLSAYVIHDLKNILAQLSLMVSNAEKHKGNPAFIDDMVDTVNNSVLRMTKLMAQLRSDTGAADQRAVNICTLLEDVVEESRLREPSPEFVMPSECWTVVCEKERLHAVFGHLVHNAQDATDRDGHVSVRLRYDHESVVVEIEDSGEGMDEDFIKNRLFKPFDSTKGLTGMGIGAFESRDFIRSIGGEIGVTSTPGAGSLFSVRIPGHPADTDTSQHAEEGFNL